VDARPLHIPTFPEFRKRDKEARVEEDSYRQSRLCRLLGNPIAFVVVQLPGDRGDFLSGSNIELLNLERRAQRGSRQIFQTKAPAVFSSRSKSVTGSCWWEQIFPALITHTTVNAAAARVS